MLLDFIQQNISSLFLVLTGLSIMMIFTIRDFTRTMLVLFIAYSCIMMFFVFLPVARDIKEDLFINLISILLTLVFTFIAGVGIVSRMQENFNRYKNR